MRILALDLGTERRGGQLQTFFVSRELVRRSHQVTVVVPAGSPLAKDLRQEAGGGLSLVELSEGPEVSPRLLLGVARTIQRHAPDVIWASDARGHGSVIWSLGVWRFPLVVHRRVVFAPGRGPLNWLKYALVDRFFAVSHAVRRSLLAAGVPEGKVVVLPDGIPDNTTVVVPESPAPPYRLVHAGAFDKMKGQELVVAVLAQLVASGVDASALFLGDGPARRSVEEAARAAGVEARCTFAGCVRDVPQQLARSHLLLLPSESEAAPLILLEAMAAGCPVLAHDVGGVSEVTDGERAGRLVSGLDPAAWSAAARPLLFDRRLRENLVAAGREVASKRTVAASVTQMEDELELLLARKRRRGR